MIDDPLRSHFGHPILPAGYNADDNNGDEVDGAGTNWSIWPALFDTFIGLKTLVITGEMMDIFDNTCPDYIAPGEPNLITWPVDNWELQARNPWLDIVLPADPSLIMIPYQSRELNIRHEPDTEVIKQEGKTHTVRRTR